MAPVLAAHRDYSDGQVTALRDLHAVVAGLADTARNRPDIRADRFLDLIRRTVMVEQTAQRRFSEEAARAFSTLYFAQLTAGQPALSLWYAQDARLTVERTDFLGATAVSEQLHRFPRAGYDIDDVEVESDSDLSARFKVGGLVGSGQRSR